MLHVRLDCYFQTRVLDKIVNVSALWYPMAYSYFYSMGPILEKNESTLNATGFLGPIH
jgi:hypothetical protein